MRRLGVVAHIAFACVAGCSVVWDMDPYETGTSEAATDADGGRANDGGGTSASGGSSGGATSSSGSSSGEDTLGVDASRFDAGTPLGDAGSDAGTPPTCHFESEPNDSEVDADEISFKKTCGAVAPTDPFDYFFIDVGVTEVIGVEVGPNVRFTVTYPDGSKDSTATPGGYYVTLKAGENNLKFQSTAAYMGAYAIYRQ